MEVNERFTGSSTVIRRYGDKETCSVVVVKAEEVYIVIVEQEYCGFTEAEFFKDLQQAETRAQEIYDTIKEM